MTLTSVRSARHWLIPAFMAMAVLGWNGVAQSDVDSVGFLPKRLLNSLIQPPLAPAAVARADITSCDGSPISGALFLLERDSEEGVKTVDVLMFSSGLPDGKHAVHIHETAVCEPCSGALGHFDPGPMSNSSPDGNHPFHAGDLVNVEVTNGIGILRTTTTRISLTDGPLSIFDDDGSAVIVHTDMDSYCPDGEVAGCAGGSRAACGIIMPF